MNAVNDLIKLLEVWHAEMREREKEAQQELLSAQERRNFYHQRANMASDNLTRLIALREVMCEEGGGK